MIMLVSQLGESKDCGEDAVGCGFFTAEVF